LRNSREIDFMNLMEKLGAWIADNPIIIVAAALILTIFSFHYAQQIEMRGMDTESFVGKDSPLYQLYDHLYKENFGTESIAVLIEGGDVTEPEVLQACLRFSDHMMLLPGVVDVQNVARMVANAEAETDGVRKIPSQERIEEIIAGADPDLMNGIMPDRGHTLIAVVEPTSLNEEQRNRVLAETNAAIRFAEIPPGYTVTVTG